MIQSTVSIRQRASASRNKSVPHQGYSLRQICLKGTRRNYRVFRQLLVGSSAGAVCIACSDVRPVAPVQAPPMAKFVTAQVLEQISATGEVQLPGPIPYPYPQINEEVARVLADGYRKVFLPQISSVVEKDRGARINLVRLHVCKRTFYVEPSVEALPPVEHPGARRAFGPYWTVPFCGGTGVPQVSIAVSALATDLKFDGKKFVYPSEGGMFFFSVGIPIKYNEGLPGSPENAIRAVGEETGARISAVPRLVGIPLVAPQLAMWYLALDHPVEVRSTATGKIRVVSAVFYKGNNEIGRAGMWVPKEGARPTREYPSVIAPATPKSPPVATRKVVPFRPGLAGELEPVEAVKQ